MAPKGRTLLHTYFLIISMHSVFQETLFFCRKQRGNEGGGGILDYICPPPSGPPDNLTGPNWHTAHLDHVSDKIKLQLSL